MDEFDKKLSALLEETINDETICVSEDLIERTKQRIKEAEKTDTESTKSKKRHPVLRFPQIFSMAAAAVLFVTIGVSMGILRQSSKNMENFDGSSVSSENNQGNQPFENSAGKSESSASVDHFTKPFEDAEPGKKPLATQAPCNPALPERNEDKMSASEAMKPTGPLDWKETVDSTEYVTLSEKLILALKENGFAVRGNNAELTGMAEYFSEETEEMIAEKLREGILCYGTEPEEGEYCCLILSTKLGQIKLYCAENFFKIVEAE